MRAYERNDKKEEVKAASAPDKGDAKREVAPAASAENPWKEVSILTGLHYAYCGNFSSVGMKDVVERFLQRPGFDLYYASANFRTANKFVPPYVYISSSSGFHSITWSEYPGVGPGTDGGIREEIRRFEWQRFVGKAANLLRQQKISHDFTALCISFKKEESFYSALAVLGRENFLPILPCDANSLRQLCVKQKIFLNEKRKKHGIESLGCVCEIVDADDDPRFFQYEVGIEVKAYKDALWKALRNEENAFVELEDLIRKYPETRFININLFVTGLKKEIVARQAKNESSAYLLEAILLLNTGDEHDFCFEKALLYIQTAQELGNPHAKRIYDEMMRGITYEDLLKIIDSRQVIETQMIKSLLACPELAILIVSEKEIQGILKLQGIGSNKNEIEKVLRETHEEAKKLIAARKEFEEQCLTLARLDKPPMPKPLYLHTMGFLGGNTVASRGKEMEVVLHLFNKAEGARIKKRG